MTGKAFSVKLSDAIRHHLGERRALESRRENAFSDRDAALEEKREITDRESGEYLAACRRHSDAIAEIDSLSHSIRWHGKQLDVLMEKPDEQQLDFMYDPPQEPARPKQLKLAGGEASGGEEPARPDPRPVGRVGRPRPEVPAPDMGDGVDEHLKASVNELDCRENIKGKLIAAGLTTIGSVVEVLDDSRRHIVEIASLTDKQDGELRKAVGGYRSKHRKADLAASGEKLRGGAQ